MDLITILNFYQDYAREFIGKYKTENLENYNEQCKKLEKTIETQNEPVHACFFGASGIGKSTLLNAIIAEHKVVLPAGGIGPLTAQAITVRYGDISSFKAEYHDRGNINRVNFALERFYRGLQKEEQKAVDMMYQETAGLDDDYRQEIDEMASADGDEARREKKENMIKLARLMITNRQDSDQELPYLIDGLLTVSGKQSKYNSQLTEDDLNRIEQLRNAVNSGSAEYAEDGSTIFDEMKRNHAAGYFAPIIKNLEVQWKSDLLKTGLILVDLPGVGIAGDVYKNITSEYLRNKAKAVILVVSTRGVTESDAAVLRESGFMNRLLYSVDEPTNDPVSLIVAVTKVDDIAATRYRSDTQKEKKKWQHLADVCSETEVHVRTQLMSQLRKEWIENDEYATEQKEKVLRDIDNSLQVIPLSAIEYSKYCADDEEDRPFIKDVTQSNIPRIKEYLSSIVTAITEERAKRLQEHSRQFALSVRNQIELIEAELLSEERTLEEQQRLEKDLDGFLKPLRDEYKSREGAFRNYLKKSIPIKVESLVINCLIIIWTSWGSLMYTNLHEDNRCAQA